MSNYKVNINGKEVQVKLLEKDGSRLKFNVSGNLYDIDISSAASSDAEDHTGYSGADHKKEITAPMPGVIVKIHVKEKQAIKAGQTIISIEAMKMENNILASADCKIKKIHIKQGMEVKNNQLLVTLE